ncbi:hypothetical protein H1D32_23030 [Anaerobacillus sp. CMMVII]|uniref:hypothetical protein n=1 Tax=Anaerobacillus sp. CMMVII TaxID=2755588 RepID=UPI0021B7FB12|nr:hypothetical protein [Anaerobacillus sp. CMMVII]MCT8140318.1 hypothetical protein [Anaerobacillus sp. CMMVII]
MFLSYVKVGFIAGFITTVIANLLFFTLGLVFGHEANFIGQERDTLYIVFITFATFTAVFLSSIIFYFLQKISKKPLLWFYIVVIFGFVFNTYTAEVDLLDEYKLTAHFLHAAVSLLAIYLVPMLSRK